MAALCKHDRPAESEGQAGRARQEGGIHQVAKMFVALLRVKTKLGARQGGGILLYHGFT